MNLQEAKFILRASRPDGQDAADPQVRAALEFAQRDPDLARWLERERAADRTIAAALAAVPPPAGLRAQLLAGARASRVEFPWWRRTPVFAAAAAVALLLSVGGLTWQLTRPTPHTWAEFAAYDLADAHYRHDGHQRPVADVEARLARADTRLAALDSIDAADLKSRGCRSLNFAGREVFEVCFERDGTWFHLYVTRRAAGDPAAGAAPVIAAQRGGHVATWADARHTFALVASAEAEVLRRVL